MSEENGVSAIDELIDRLEGPCSWECRITGQGDEPDITRGSFAPKDAAEALKACREYLKPHEMPVDRMRRDHSEAQTLLKLYADTKKENERLRSLVKAAYQEGMDTVYEDGKNMPFNRDVAWLHSQAKAGLVK